MKSLLTFIVVLCCCKSNEAQTIQNDSATIAIIQTLQDFFSIKISTESNGHLKFVSFLRSIPYLQYNVSEVYLGNIVPVTKQGITSAAIPYEVEIEAVSDCGKIGTTAKMWNNYKTVDSMPHSRNWQKFKSHQRITVWGKLIVRQNSWGIWEVLKNPTAIAYIIGRGKIRT